MFKFFIITTLFCFNAFAVEKIPPNVESSYRLIGVEQTLIGVAENRMTAQGKMIDSNTQFISASASGKTLSFTHKILKDKSDLSISKIKEVMYKQLQAAICVQPLSYFLIVDMGATYTFNYYDKSNFFIFQLNYSKKDCLS
jgi:hypothetical protein